MRKSRSPPQRPRGTLLDELQLLVERLHLFELICSSTRSSVRPPCPARPASRRSLDGVAHVACAQLLHPVLVEAVVVDERTEGEWCGALRRGDVPVDGGDSCRVRRGTRNMRWPTSRQARALAVALHAALQLVDDLDLKLALVTTGEERGEFGADALASGVSPVDWLKGRCRRRRADNALHRERASARRAPCASVRWSCPPSAAR